jgi:outer membrane lipoprotein-sorting protein
MKYTADHNLDKAVESFKHQKPLPQEIERAQDHLLRVVEAEKDNETLGFLQRLSAWWKESVNFSGFKLAGSMGAVASFALAIFIFSASSQVSFASVVANLKSVHSMFYTATMTNAGEHLMEMKVYYRSSGQLRVESYALNNRTQPVFINIMDVREGKGVMRLVDSGETIPLSLNSSNITPSAQEDPLYWRKLILGTEIEHAKPLGTKTFAGTELSGFLIENAGIETRIWVDQESQLPVRIHVVQFLGGADVGFEMHANVTYNQRFDDNLFQLN